MDAERRLEAAEMATARAESASQKLGNQSQTTARNFEKLNEKISDNYKSLSQSITAFNKNEISAKQLDAAIRKTSNSFGSLESKARDYSARIADASSKTMSFGTKLGLITTAGNLFGNAIGNIASEIKQFVADGIKLNAGLDKLARYVGTVDDALRNPIGLQKFKKEMQDLSEMLPYSADQFAKASYTITSGLQLFGKDRVKLRTVDLQSL